MWGKENKKPKYQSSGNVWMIPTAEIQPNPEQPRRDFSYEKLLELAQSIGENGLLHPVTVTFRDGVPVLVAGERRLRAAKIAGIREIPCIELEAEGVQRALLTLVENLQRQDMNIYSTAQISFAQAALGGEIRIHTVDGDVLYEVKPGTQTNTRIRLKGKGVPSLRNKNVRGDHYVTFVVQVPTNLNEEAKEALRKFDEACGNRPKSKDSDDFEKPEKKKKSFMDKLKETFED